MKKSIGLTADISTFNTTLPQTRHLNYFMNTNPQRFAKGGDVSQGIPNYPNPNVTSGFLPMALGFDNGGEANGYFSKLYRAAIKVVAGYLGKSEDDEQVKEIAKKFIETDNGKAIANKLLTQDEAYKVDVPSDRQPGIDIANQMQPVTPKDTVTTTPSNRQPQFNIPQPVAPEPITTRSDRQGAFDNVPLQPLPKISTEQQQREYEDSQKPTEPKPQMTPPVNSGITSITPSDRQPGIGISNEIKQKKELPLYLKPLDLNGDGEVNIEDYNIAKEKGLSIADKIAEFLGIIGDELEDLNPDKTEKITPSDRQPPIDEGIKTIEKDNKKDDKDEDGITSIKPSDRQPQFEPEDQNTLKKGAEIFGKSNQEQIEIANKGGISAIDSNTPDKTKKDVPAWALPMMSAGFAMMASKSPYFMQALGEAGQAGLETYSAQKTAEEDKLDKESSRKLQEAQADYYSGGGRQGRPDIKVMDYQGKPTYHRYDAKTNSYVPLMSGGQPQVAVPSDEDIIKQLEGTIGWETMTNEEKNNAIKERRNLLLGIVESNLNTNQDKSAQDTSWLPSLPELLKILEDFNPDVNKKDGGIVSIRR
jgi:hypothetical protein